MNNFVSKERLNKNLSVGAILISLFIIIQLIALNTLVLLVFQKQDKNWFLYATIVSGVFLILILSLNILTFMKNKKYKLLILVWVIITIYFFTLPLGIGVWGIINEGLNKGFNISLLLLSATISVPLLVYCIIPILFIYSKIIKIIFMFKYNADFCAINPLYPYTNI